MRAAIRAIRESGFSFTELIIDIVAIGLLIGLVLNSYSALETRMRDVKRQTAINAIATALEACYNAVCNGTYPSLVQLQDDSAKGWTTTNFKNFSATTLYDTKGRKIQGDSPSDAAEYQYKPYKADGTTCNVGETCDRYVLSAWQEEGATNMYTKNSLNK